MQSEPRVFAVCCGGDEERMPLTVDRDRKTNPFTNGEAFHRNNPGPDPPHDCGIFGQG